ncbi:MAG: hypothetical protein ABW185_29940 [Sedimenticola sp.]
MEEVETNRTEKDTSRLNKLINYKFTNAENDSKCTNEEQTKHRRKTQRTKSLDIRAFFNPKPKMELAKENVNSLTEMCSATNDLHTSRVVDKQNYPCSRPAEWHLSGVPVHVSASVCVTPGNSGLRDSTPVTVFGSSQSGAGTDHRSAVIARDHTTTTTTTTESDMLVAEADLPNIPVSNVIPAIPASGSVSKESHMCVCIPYLFYISNYIMFYDV